jgi:hypothetical protein
MCASIGQWYSGFLKALPYAGTAATVWSFVLANYVLSTVTGLSIVQRILIRDSTTSLGQALVHVARQTGGVEIFVAIRTPDEKALLVNKLNLSRQSLVIVNGLQDMSRLASYFSHMTHVKVWMR